jgi:hypothetical protein
LFPGVRDWARFRALAFAGDDALQKIKEVAHIPRWGRAIRLYAQGLAERGDQLAAWKAATKLSQKSIANIQVGSELLERRNVEVMRCRQYSLCSLRSGMQGTAQNAHFDCLAGRTSRTSDSFVNTTGRKSFGRVFGLFGSVYR